MDLKKALLLAGFGAAASGMTAVTATSAGAWCSPYMQVEATLDPSARMATPGTAIRITGHFWDNGTYQLVWAPSRQLIATVVVTTNGRFAADLVTPEVDPQAYGTPDARLQIKVEQGGKVGNDALTLEVLDPRKAPPPPVVDSSPGVPQSNTVGRPLSVATTVPGSFTGPAGPGGAATQTPLLQAPGRSATQGAPTLQPGGGTSSGPAAAPSVSPALGLAGLVQPSVATVNRPASPAVAGDVTGAPSSKTALGDLWDGFNSGLRSRTSGPGLADLPATGSHPLVSPGALLLLPVGLSALAAGFGLTEARRRRVLAS